MLECMWVARSHTGNHWKKARHLCKRGTLPINAVIFVQVSATNIHVCGRNLCEALIILQLLLPPNLYKQVTNLSRSMKIVKLINFNERSEVVINLLFSRQRLLEAFLPLRREKSSSSLVNGITYRELKVFLMFFTFSFSFLWCKLSCFDRHYEVYVRRIRSRFGFT